MTSALASKPKILNPKRKLEINISEKLLDLQAEV